MKTGNENCRWTLRRADSRHFILEMTGTWRLESSLPAPDEILKEASHSSGTATLAFDTQNLGGWNSGLILFLNKLTQEAGVHRVEILYDGLPDGVRRLLTLLAAKPVAEVRSTSVAGNPVALLGVRAVRVWTNSLAGVTFLGESVAAFGRFLGRSAHYRVRDLAQLIQECGAAALPIVSLISFLVGLILAFVGAVQLQKFGAEIYVADLVGIAMAREMGALMTAIIMAGRTGAAFAAQLGTMTVNEEIDALRTLGLSPVEFLVLPRMLALSLMMPLLCLYSDVIGILGGAVVAVGMMDITVVQYWEQTRQSLTLTHFSVGLAKSVVFGILVALAGCLRGMQSGRSASAVGEAATSAVVTAIVWIIVTDAIFAVLTNILDV